MAGNSRPPQRTSTPSGSRDHHGLECVSVDDHRVCLRSHFQRIDLRALGTADAEFVGACPLDFDRPHEPQDANLHLHIPDLTASAPEQPLCKREWRGGLIIHVREFARFVRAWLHPAIARRALLEDWQGPSGPIGWTGSYATVRRQSWPPRSPGRRLRSLGRAKREGTRGAHRANECASLPFRKSSSARIFKNSPAFVRIPVTCSSSRALLSRASVSARSAPYAINFASSGS